MIPKLLQLYLHSTGFSDCISINFIVLEFGQEWFGFNNQKLSETSLSKKLV